MSHYKTVEQVVQALKDHRVEFVVNSTHSSVTEAVARELGGGGRGAAKMVLLTSKKLFQSYDPVHPERIVAILLKRCDWTGAPMTVVVCNNRMNYKARFWVQAEFDGDCSICLEKVACISSGAEAKIVRSHTRCSTCDKFTCVDCLRKIESRAHPGGSFKCPMCATWNLSGPAFGTPLADLQVGEGGGGVFLDAFKRLDGRVRVVPVVEGLMIFDSEFELVRCSVSSNIESGSIRHIFRAFVRFSEEAKKRSVDFFVERTTYRIADKDPIVELAKFRIDSKKRILQLPKDAWHAEEYRRLPDCDYVKVELVPAHEFRRAGRLLDALTTTLSNTTADSTTLSNTTADSTTLPPNKVEIGVVAVWPSKTKRLPGIIVSMSAAAGAAVEDKPKVMADLDAMMDLGAGLRFEAFERSFSASSKDGYATVRVE